jgi:SAM-dependent methyltransferase
MNKGVSFLADYIIQRARLLLSSIHLHNFWLYLKSEEDNWERSRTRWRETEPQFGLTWGRDISGDNFISKVSSYDAFSLEKTILEIGPGYGRLLTACQQQKIPFKKYVGADISIKNIKYLQEKFPDTNIDFIHGDAEAIKFDERFDLVLSSLTFKHLFPDFKKVLYNILNYVNPNGMFFFDLIEGNKRYFQYDGVTYLRFYLKVEIQKILNDVSLELVAFDQVQHDLDYSRLFVVARKPK